MILNLSDKKKLWKEEENFAFKGWDFSHISGRWESEILPWEYREIVEQYLQKDFSLLDMGTGGGEFLLSLDHDRKLLSATEGYLPNFELCKKELSPLGINVKFVAEDNKLEFPGSNFDIVLNRHETFDISEVHRVLKHKGIFITQQIGGENDIDLSKRIIKDFKPVFLDNRLDLVVPKLEKLGFEILFKHEVFTPIRFFDTGALVYFAKIIEWEFPNFSVESCLEELKEIDNEIVKNGFIEGTEHRYILIARKE